MAQYGPFSAAVAELDHALSTVRSVWTDQTAATYDTINDNMQTIAQRIWASREAAAAGEAAVRENYNEGEYDSILNSLGGRIAGL